MRALFSRIFDYLEAVCYLALAGAAFFTASMLLSANGSVAWLGLLFAGLGCLGLRGCYTSYSGVSASKAQQAMRPEEIQRHLEKVSARHLAQLEREAKRRPVQRSSP
jgi:hypothetical protein